MVDIVPANEEIMLRTGRSLMGYSGGGGGGATLAHVHSGAAGQGGALSNATLLNVPTLVSQLHILEVIETHEASGTELTFTFSFTAVDFDDDSELLLVMDGSIVGSMNLDFRFNGDVTSNYFTDGEFVANGVEVINDFNSLAFGRLGDNNAGGLQSANDIFSGEVKITLSKSGTLDQPTAVYAMRVADGIQFGTIRLEIASADIDSLTIFASANGWAAGTRMTLYRVKRA